MEISPDLQPVLRQIGDLERVLARLALRTARPRDLARMRHAFSQYPDIQAQLSAVSDPYIQTLQQRIGQFDELQALLERAVVEAPPVLVRDGGVIALATMKNWMSGEPWRTAPVIISTNWKSASGKNSASIH